MRTIKFRAWSKGEKKMFWNVQNAYDTLYFHGPESEQEGNEYARLDKYYFHPSSFGSVLKDDDFEIMQFTGLHDKNGKEIYEEDIVRFTDGDSEDFKIIKVWFGEKGVEEYYKCLGFWLGDEDGWPEAEEIEIIGNIYENPELLK